MGLVQYRGQGNADRRERDVPAGGSGALPRASGVTTVLLEASARSPAGQAEVGALLRHVAGGQDVFVEADNGFDGGVERRSNGGEGVVGLDLQRTCRFAYGMVSLAA